jgi:hypothetical protein
MLTQSYQFHVAIDSDMPDRQQTHSALRCDVWRGGRGSVILSETTSTGIRVIVSITMVHDIRHDFIPFLELRMPSTDALALRQSGLNEFLFAPVGN